MHIDKLKRYIESSNLNFLFGAGLSSGYLSLLGPVEKLLTALNEISLRDEVEAMVRNSLYRYYFLNVIKPNLESEYSTSKTDEYQNVLNDYTQFLKECNELMTKRKNNLIGKQINIFTTNIDMFVERSAALLRIEFNDGFRGRNHALFEEESFGKFSSRQSILMQNITELPMFHYHKVHGSIGWARHNSVNIMADDELSNVKEIASELAKIDVDYFIDEKEITKIDVKIKDLVQIAQAKLSSFSKSGKSTSPEIYKGFSDSYQKIVMINPNKAKFRETVIDYHFYELIRLFSNALERQNSMLIVSGFSFADEHIAQIVRRAANSNPTLLVLVLNYDDNSESIEKNLNLNEGIINNNIQILTPSKFSKAQRKDDGRIPDWVTDLSKFDLESINKYILQQINETISQH